MPQPLNTISPKAAKTPVQWGASAALKAYPELAVLVLETIAIWSEADRHLADALTNLISTDVEIVADMFRDIKLEARTTALHAAARTRFKPEDYNLFAAALSTTKASRSRRDEFAHHIWGTSPEIQDALILADPRDLVREIAAIMGPLMRSGGSGSFDSPTYSHGTPWDSSKYFAYRKVDLEASVGDAKRACLITSRLRCMTLINPPIYRPEQFDSTCNELRSDPLVQQRLQPKSKQIDPSTQTETPSQIQSSEGNQ